MQLPSEIAVMTLPNVILFPQAMMPLFIFEPRYRQMLAVALESHRMFSVAMQKPGRVREAPCAVAGLGLIRASVANQNGTSNLILQGIARVELGEAVQTKPYRIHTIRPLLAEDCAGSALGGLTKTVRTLVRARLKQGLQLPPQVMKKLAEANGGVDLPALNSFSLEQILKYLEEIEDPEQIVDIVSHTLLTIPTERQKILETIDLEKRLEKLVRFLVAEIERHRDTD
ncbi:MAG: LON peptidase substrate-binding domain-containing protein [Verrucomicrobia bacterium]|nr:LON peptidase substrate-binding domain-containing protein [Verrucomicrobiota bacterium]